MLPVAFLCEPSLKLLRLIIVGFHGVVPIEEVSSVGHRLFTSNQSSQTGNDNQQQ
jgi:hypothetical protein